MLVQHWMTRDVVTVEADMPFLEARVVMKGKRIRHLPIVERGKLIGVVTDRDLKQAAPSGATTLDVFELNYLLLKMKVRDLITRDPITIRPTNSVEKAALLMHDHKIGCLPVVDETGSLVGMITETDLLEVMVEILGYKEKGTRIAFEVLDTPEACQELVHVLRDFRLDLRSLVTCALHTRPGYRDFVIRVKGEQADALVTELKAKYGAGVSVLVT
ncbi:MAG: CBS domain-containing protein [candidate division NC10 bacterium]|nr:CBS domain-containing protein [candidate division NC10 bacterium]MBI2163077.1 CBS domain-containing protein [candidate division NC10 bacterium]MBI2456572.1 CBS domain-containing protein [candidate division NC10 bacterium]MBI2563101.1 CBS domain-containing protein [candidate division NC10 bacterium]